MNFFSTKGDFIDKEYELNQVYATIYQARKNACSIDPPFTRTAMSSRVRSAAHLLHAGRVDAAGAAVAALLVEVPADLGVVAAGLELLVLLDERAGLAAVVHAAVAAGLVRERVLGAHLGAVGAGVDPVAPRERRQQHVERAARPTRRRAPVHDLRHLPERDARAPASQATCTDHMY